VAMWQTTRGRRDTLTSVRIWLLGFPGAQGLDWANTSRATVTAVIALGQPA